MKLRILLLCFSIFAVGANAQNFTVSYTQQPTCFGVCDGVITFTTSFVTGPFTAIVSSSACPNSTVQNSTNNSISISSICACANVYTVTIFTGTTVVGSEIFQYPNYATSALVVNVSNILGENCAGCCNGAANVSYTGGNIQGTPTFSMDGVPVTSVTPASNLCSGNHTVCMTDASNCIACKVFNIPLLTGLADQESEFPVSIYPNPANGAIFIESTIKNPVSKIEIFSVAGSKMMEYIDIQNRESKLKLDIVQLNPGLYFLNAYNADGTLMQHKRFFKTTD